MNETIDVNIPQNDYTIYIEDNFSSLPKYMKEHDILGKVVIISDSNVSNYYLDACFEELKIHGYHVLVFCIDAGEASKDLDSIQLAYHFLIEQRIERKDTIIALGGGVVGDFAGFVAATYLRGIRYVQVPTSLLAQIDSSIGGKVGINHLGIKNNIGAFYQPLFVFTNISTLETLPKREFRSGLAEALVHALIVKSDLLEFMVRNLERILLYDINILRDFIYMNCKIKSMIVEQDVRETGRRELLNLGHTIGHGIEVSNTHGMLHGECVAIGIIGDLLIARYMAVLKDTELINKVVEILRRMGLPTSYSQLNTQKVLSKIYFDKKNLHGINRFLLPEKIGKVLIKNVEDEKIIILALEELMNEQL